MARKRSDNLDWKAILNKPIKKIPDVSDKEILEINKVVKKYPIRINSYYLSLIKKKNDPIYKQCVPSIKELEDDLLNDPLAEEENSPVKSVVHRYPDRVLLFVSNQCAMYCRFCTRKRMVGKSANISKRDIDSGIRYIKAHPEIRDVILSGGDPLLLSDKEIDAILKRVRDIKHVQIIRIGSRLPCTLPQRITKELCAILKKYHPLYLNTHFNHPDEITAEAAKACSMLADNGIPLSNQTVLLKGVNDSPKVMKALVQKLLTIRVRPYYIYHADLAKGTAHFRTTLKKGLEIIKSIRGWTSGLAVPHYVIDSPGGGGKIPVLPEYLKEYKNGKIKLRNYQDKEFVCFDP